MRLFITKNLLLNLFGGLFTLSLLFGFSIPNSVFATTIYEQQTDDTGYIQDAGIFHDVNSGAFTISPFVNDTSGYYLTFTIKASNILIGSAQILIDNSTNSVNCGVYQFTSDDATILADNQYHIFTKFLTYNSDCSVETSFVVRIRYLDSGAGHNGYIKADVANSLPYIILTDSTGSTPVYHFDSILFSYPGTNFSTTTNYINFVGTYDMANATSSSYNYFLHIYATSVFGFSKDISIKLNSQYGSFSTTSPYLDEGLWSYRADLEQCQSGATYCQHFDNPIQGYIDEDYNYGPIGMFYPYPKWYSILFPASTLDFPYFTIGDQDLSYLHNFLGEGQGAISTSSRYIATTTCSLAEIAGCIQNAFILTFVPSRNVVQNFSNIGAGILESPPIGYFFVIRDFIKNFGTTTSTTTIFVISPMVITAIAPISNLIKMIFTIIFPLLMIFYIYHRLRKWEFQA